MTEPVPGRFGAGVYRDAILLFGWTVAHTVLDTYGVYVGFYCTPRVQGPK